MKLANRLIKKIDYTLIIAVLIICVFGVVVISSATNSLSSGSERFIRTQSVSIVLGIFAILIILLFDYKTFARFHIPIYVICNLMLIAVLILGTGREQWGANRWLVVAGFSFQPSEFAKIGIVISLAKMIASNKENIHKLTTLIKVIAYVSLPIGLILVQPDLGTSLTFVFFTFGILFAAGIRYKHIIITTVVGALSMPIIWMFLEEYQKTRIRVFLNPGLDPLGAGLQILQSKLAIGSGMVTGKGLYEGVQTQFGFLPERQTDFIFSVIAEELGFIGVMFLIVMFIFILLKCIKIAREAKDDFGAYLVIGLTFMLAFHIFGNIAMTIGLMPVTGKPLPFISYGGTFMLSNMIAIGLILNVGMRKDLINF
ncbi:MAG: rod shape-determining protein RodA [Alkaliphilus sp.]